MEKQTILQEHNRARQMLALGNVAGQPAAINMREMVWDEELARMEDETLKEVDDALDSQAKEAKARYDRWDQDNLSELSKENETEVPNTGGPCHLKGVGAPLDQTNTRARPQPPSPPLPTHLQK